MAKQDFSVDLSSLRLRAGEIADLIWYWQTADGECGVRCALGSAGGGRTQTLSDDVMSGLADERRRAHRIGGLLRRIGRDHAKILWRVHGGRTWRGLGAFGTLGGVAVVTPAARAHALRALEAEHLGRIPSGVPSEVRARGEVSARRAAARQAPSRAERLLADACHRAATGRGQDVATEAALVYRAGREAQALYAAACAAYRAANDASRKAA